MRLLILSACLLFGWNATEPAVAKEQSATFQSENGQWIDVSLSDDGAIFLLLSDDNGHYRTGLTPFHSKNLFCWGFPDSGCIFAYVPNCGLAVVQRNFRQLKSVCLKSSTEHARDTSVSMLEVEPFDKNYSITALTFDSSGSILSITRATADGEIVNEYTLQNGKVNLVEQSRRQ